MQAPSVLHVFIETVLDEPLFAGVGTILSLSIIFVRISLFCKVVYYYKSRLPIYIKTKKTIG